MRCLLLNVDLVRDAYARDVRALVSHLSVPLAQVLVSDLPHHIEDHDTDVGAEIVRRM